MAYIRRRGDKEGSRVRIRQLALVAQELEPRIREIGRVFGLPVAYRDPGVGVFGLENALFAIGDQFLEVVSPRQPGTSAGRFLERRRGDGGYMVILQTRDLAGQRSRLERLGVRVVWETSLEDIATIHLHPRDVGGAIVSLDEAVPAASWRWAGPEWRRAVRTDVVSRIAGATLQAEDPAALSARWAQVLDAEAGFVGDGAYAIALEGGWLRFAKAKDDRGDGLAELELEGPDPARALEAARSLGLPSGDDFVNLCGTRFRLRPGAAA